MSISGRQIRGNTIPFESFEDESLSELTPEMIEELLSETIEDELNDDDFRNTD